MAEITLLTPEQVAEREQKPKGQGRSGRRRSPARTRIIEEYKAVVQNVQPGFGADVLLPEDEDKKQVRRNLKAAADELDMALAFRPIKDKHRIHFRFITPEEQAARPKRGGRPRKHAQAEADGASEHVQDAANERPRGLQEAPAEPPKKRTRRPRSAAREAAS